jgi:predicted nucleic acid-binding protein
VTRVVVDASVAVKWFLPEELSADASTLLAADYRLLAPDLLWVELANALWKKHRRRELDVRTASRVLGDFARVPIEFHATEPWIEGALDLATRHGITVYDALYLALATGNGCQLITADRRFHDACRSGPVGYLIGWLGTSIPG